MLTNTQWNALCKAQKHLENEIGKTFYHKELEEEVEIIYYTLSGQLFFKGLKSGTRSYIWDKDYFELYERKEA